MSTFYGTLQGSRGDATRQGTAASGIRASAQSYEGSITTMLETGETGHRAYICKASGSSASVHHVLYSGPLHDLMAADHLIPATEDTTDPRGESLILVIPGVGPVRLTCIEDEETGTRSFDAFALTREGE